MSAEEGPSSGWRGGGDAFEPACASPGAGGAGDGLPPLRLALELARVTVGTMRRDVSSRCRMRAPLPD